MEAELRAFNTDRVYDLRLLALVLTCRLGATIRRGYLMEPSGV